MRVGLTASIALLTSFAIAPTGAQQSPASAPTFSKDVAPILYKNCVSCHRPGEVAPMSLLTYDQARPWAKAILKVTSNGTMPPWHADAPAGTFNNERALTDRERQTLSDWVAAGAPNGDSRDLPAPPTFADGWTLGTPDVVLEMQEDYRLPARGTIQYEWFYIPTNFTEPKWVTAIDVRPGDRAAVHHVLVYHRAKPDSKQPAIARGNKQHQSNPPPDEEGVSQRPRRRDLNGMPPRLVATYAPGTNPQVTPPGTAFRLEPGGFIELQMHYTATGKPTSDRTKIGITFSKERAPREVVAQHFMNMQMKLPAGAADVPIATDLEFLQDATVWGIFPHTHLRGKRWAYQLVLPSGETRSILSVPRYDFNWQTYYMFREPLRVPKGAKIVSTAWYDNSAANKSNPDPTKEVLWGDQTWQEMQYTGILLSPNW